MTYRTFEQDLPYLLGKFRNPSFDPATGLDNETIEETSDCSRGSWPGNRARL